jgi:type IV secretory pathway TrbD component
VERFVRAIVAGGLALVAGLWIVASTGVALPWLLGVALIVVGSGGLVVGIVAELDAGPGLG